MATSCHGSVEDTKLSTNKQHSLSRHTRRIATAATTIHTRRIATAATTIHTRRIATAATTIHKSKFMSIYVDVPPLRL
jgi:hypothetical protein